MAKEKKDRNVAKAEKKLEKAKQKEAQKREYEEAGDDNPDTVGSKILVTIVALIIALVWIVIFAILIKMDVGGFGSTVLYPMLKDVPYINRILPEVEEYVEESPYSTVDQAIDQIKILETQLEEQKKANSSYVKQIEELQEEVNQLVVYKNNQEEFEILKENFYKEVVFGDGSPDIKEYQKYYEAIEPANAASIYREVMAEHEVSKELEDYVATYSNMKPAAAAAIFDTMTKDISLVAKILDNMEPDARGKILAAMDVDMAARITKILNP